MLMPFLKMVVVSAPFAAAWYALTVVIAISGHPCKSFKYPLGMNKPVVVDMMVGHKQALSGTMGAPHEMKSSMSTSVDAAVAAWVSFLAQVKPKFPAAPVEPASWQLVIDWMTSPTTVGTTLSRRPLLIVPGMAIGTVWVALAVLT